MLWNRERLKISGLYDENCARGTHLKFMHHRHNNDSAKVKGITSGLLEFEVFLKYPEIIIMRFGENNVLCPKYIDIYKFRGVRGGSTYSTVHFLFIIQKNGKSTRA